MRLGGYYPFRSEQERFELRVNAGFFDDIGSAFNDAFGGSSGDSGSSAQDDRGFFESGSLQGGRGGQVFERERSRADMAAGGLAAGFLGGLIPVPGAGLAAIADNRNRTNFQVDAQGNRIRSAESGQADTSADKRAQAQFLAQQAGGGQAGVQTATGGDNVAVTVNEQGQLVDNSGNLVNQQGQRVDENGRVLSDSELAIQRAEGITTAAAGQATEQLIGGQDRSLELLQSAANQAKAENFLGQGQILDFLQSGANQAKAENFRGQDQLLAFLQSGAGDARAANVLGAGEAQGFLSGSAADAQRFLQTQADRGITGIEDQLGITQGRLDPFTQAGVGALEREQAALGLLGVDAQQAFFDAQTKSPAQRFGEQQDEEALLRRQAATGGVTGGRQLIELGRLSSGRTATNLENQLGRLSTLSGRGQQAATQQGQFGQAAQSNIASILAQLGGRQSTVATDLGRNQANVATNLSGRQADIASNLASQQASATQNLFGRQADIASGLAANQANATQNLFGRQADIATGLGRSQVGVIQPTTTNLSNLLLGTGEQQAGAVLGQQAVRTGDLNEQRRLAAQQASERSQQDADFQGQLLGLAGTVFQKPINNFISSFL